MGLEFIDGNEAIARAAIRAGCNFFAGYPITPASTILSNMMQLLPASGGIAVQAEDEIASIGFCIGAAMAGSKAMTATSGPGISLYSENIGLAIMGETPLVIVDVQRQGPATGSATKGADGDIQFVHIGRAPNHCTVSRHGGGSLRAHLSRVQPSRDLSHASVRNVEQGGQHDV